MITMPDTRRNVPRWTAVRTLNRLQNAAATGATGDGNNSKRCRQTEVALKKTFFCYTSDYIFNCKKCLVHDRVIIYSLSLLFSTARHVKISKRRCQNVIATLTFGISSTQ